MDEIEDLKNTVSNLMEIAQTHAEGMRHITTALVSIDQRIRELEKLERKRGKNAPRLIVPTHLGGAA